MAAAAVLLLLVGGFGVAEITGITRVAARLVRLVQGPQAGQRAEAVRRPRPPIPAAGPGASTLPETDVSLDVLRLDRGFQEELQQIRDRIYTLQAGFGTAEGEEWSPDSLVVLRARLEALEEELQEGGGRESRELLSVVAGRLDELEQESHGTAVPDGAFVDESLSEIGTQLEMLEEEVRGDWP